MTASLCFAICLGFGARAAVASGASEAPGSPGSPESTEGPRSTLSIHPIGSVALNLPGFHFFQFTYEYHPGPGRLSWAWDPAVLLTDKSERDNPHRYSLWVLPIVTPRWYFRQDAQGWFGGLKLGYIHYTLVNDDEGPTYTPKQLHERTELGYSAGEFGYKRDWKVVSIYASSQLGLTLGGTFNEYTEAGKSRERSKNLLATPFGQINCGLGYRF